MTKQRISPGACQIYMPHPPCPIMSPNIDGLLLRKRLLYSKVRGASQEGCIAFSQPVQETKKNVNCVDFLFVDSVLW
jgi:hypothetical protein